MESMLDIDGFCVRESHKNNSMAKRVVLAHLICNARALLIIAALLFVLIQTSLYKAQSGYADRLTAAVEAENQCTMQMRLLIDQISSQTGKIVDLEGQKSGIASGGTQEPVAAVVIMAYNRPDYLERTIKSVLRYHTELVAKFPLFVSQDGTDMAVKTKALRFKQFIYMQHLDFTPIIVDRPGEIIAYYKIANHYKWALNKLFNERNFHRVIILEDDMEISPDFFSYFEATASLLEKDRSLIAISSWNDNGQRQFVQDPEALHRSDFFPGLGWMLTKTLWDELGPKWPKAYWDDWLRLNETRKGRQFIRPEICRTYNFGEHGSSYGQFFRQYLEPIKMNDVPVQLQSKNLTYLLKENYDSYIGSLLSKAIPISGESALEKTYNIDGDVQIEYTDENSFQSLARQFGIFPEWKAGVPRTSYKGVVMFRWQTSRLIFLTSPISLKQIGIGDKNN